MAQYCYGLLYGCTVLCHVQLILPIESRLLIVTNVFLFKITFCNLLVVGSGSPFHGSRVLPATTS